MELSLIFLDQVLAEILVHAEHRHHVFPVHHLLHLRKNDQARGGRGVSANAVASAAGVACMRSSHLFIAKDLLLVVGVLETVLLDVHPQLLHHLGTRQAFYPYHRLQVL